MNNLRYRRQFLLTPVLCEDLSNWKIHNVDNYYLYVHPDCQMVKASGLSDVYLIGYLLDPHYPQKTSKDIISELSDYKNIGDLTGILYKLTGKFVLIIKKGEDLLFFNDACGLKTLYYTKSKGKIYAASQPLLIGKVLKLIKSSIYDEYFNSLYVKKNVEHWLPIGVTFYKDVFQLTPNHYLSLSEYKQIRYWPFKKLEKGNYAGLLYRFVKILQKIMDTAQGHMDLAISLTAGWDSRILLSASKAFSQDVVYYTLKYRGMNDDSPDVKIPKLLAASLKLKHSLLDCQQEATKEFIDIYEHNTDMAHFNDWGKIAYGLYETYPQEKVAVKGNCSEVGRCYYYPYGKHKEILSEDDFLHLETGWEKMGFIKECLKNWYNETKRLESDYGYDLYDLFYWEHRMGSWQAQSQLEWDIAQEVFTPFNSRELLDLMLAIDPSYRKAYSPVLYSDAMKILWAEVLSEPINPLSNKRKFKKLIGSILTKTGVLPVLMKILKK